MELTVVPSTPLQNKTLFVIKGDNVLFNCSSKSYPSQNLSWVFKDAALNVTDKGSGTGSELDFKILHIQPKNQGNYTCRALNPISMITTEQSVMLLVYYVSEKHPDCFWHPGTKVDQVFFNCSWTGNYPTPMLQVFLDSKTSQRPSMVGSDVTENIEVSLNRNNVYEGQNITCKGNYSTPLSQEEKNCTFTLKAPYPEGSPMAAALHGTNVTLTCSELVSMPPAMTAWYRGLNYTTIIPSAKYILNEQGPYRTLTIIDVSKEDEGIFVCKSENVVAERVLEVYLTVRSSVGSGVAFGVFISIFIVAAGVSVGYLLYSRRDRICLGLRLSSPDDRTDVISLIESDEDEIFHDAIPRLPPVMNGSGSAHATTLVEIHHIHGGDHVENVNNAEQNQMQDQTQLDEEQ